MAMNSPFSPIEATRNAGMMASMMAAHDRDGFDGLERDRIEQEQLSRKNASKRNRPGLFRRLFNLFSTN